jgi:hypothetical protein
MSAGPRSARGRARTGGRSAGAGRAVGGRTDALAARRANAPAAGNGRDDTPAVAPRALNAPRAARVRMGAGGVPRAVDGRPVEHVRESWLVEDRWWTGRPLRRRYWEVVSAQGRDLVVFHDLCTGAWFRQVG